MEKKPVQNPALPKVKLTCGRPSSIRVGLLKPDKCKQSILPTNILKKGEVGRTRGKSFQNERSDLIKHMNIKTALTELNMSLTVWV